MIKQKILNFLYPDFLFRKTSFAQCGEDLMVKFIFKSVLKIDKPSYIDIGAFHPFKFNNTYLLYKFGSRGIILEPNPDSFHQFQKHRPDDLNLNYGVGVESGVLDYYSMESSTLNTFSKEEAERMEKIEKEKIREIIPIKVKTIQDILSENGYNEFPDFLSIDIEGYDLEILRTINFSSSSPKIICVETIQFSQAGNSKKNTEIINFLLENNYAHYADTMINSIFVRQDLIKNIFS